METHEFQYLLTVVSESNISKAAEKLYIAQPSLSNIIRKFEDTIGYKIFLRGPSGIELTEKGAQFITVVKKIVDEEKALDNELRDIATSDRGRIIIGVPTFWGRMILPSVLSAFRAEFDKVEITLKEFTSSALEKMLIDEEIDVAIMSLPIENKDGNIVSVPLFDVEIIVACSQENPLSRKGRQVPGRKYPIIDPQALFDQQFLVFPRAGRLHDVFERFCSQYEFEPRRSADITNNEIAMVLAAMNLGVTFIPETVLEIYKTDPMPVFLGLPEGVVDDLSIVVATKRKPYHNKIQDHFIRITTDLFGSQEKNDS